MGGAGFCTRCGSSLFYRLKEPDAHLVWLGSFDDQGSFALRGEIYVDVKPTAYAFKGEHPRLTGAEFLASIGTPEAGSEGPT